MNNGAVEELARLGLTEYQSKVYSAMATLGPSGVTEINRASGVPRTKVYETLQDLVSKGMAEFKPGRPAVYRAIRPSVLIKTLTEEYVSSAKRAEVMLEEKYETAQKGAQDDLVWIVRGDSTIRRKLAEVITSAKKSISVLETYPPVFIPSVKSVLKSASNNGSQVRAICVVRKDQCTMDFPEKDLIHYKTLILSKSAAQNGKFSDDPYLKHLSVTFSHPYGVALIDEVEAFVMMRNEMDARKSIGFSAKIPGVPAILSVMFDRLSKLGKDLAVR